MKKFVVIVAVLSLVASGFVQIPMAGAQSPTDRKAATANAGAASVGESVAVVSAVSDRVATAEPSNLGAEAFIDLTRIFKEEVGCNQEMSAIKDKIREFDQQCKQQQTNLNVLRDELRAASDLARRMQLEKELADGSAKLQTEIAETRQQFLAAEAKIYNEVYEQVRSTVAEYAKEHGIRRVTRSQSVARTEEKVDGSDRSAVLQRINRPIIYLEGPSDSPSDITDAILQRLNGVKTR